MTKLITSPNLKQPDDFYAALLQAHNGKTAEESASINAKLILLMANHIGDAEILHEALFAAAEQHNV